MAVYDDDLRLAHVIADMVDKLTTGRYLATDLRVDTKPDLTPVSDADTAVEQAIRATLKRVRPRDAVTGEELPDTGHGPRRWVLDPIDGTKNYVRGVPVWATLIALLDGRRLPRQRRQPPLQRLPGLLGHERQDEDDQIRPQRVHREAPPRRQQRHQERQQRHQRHQDHHGVHHQRVQR